MVIFGGIPLIAGQAVEVFRVNDGEFALCKRDFSKGVAVANPPIYKQYHNKQAFEAVGNVDGHSDFQLSPGLKVLNPKH